MPKAKPITLSNGKTYESLNTLLKDFNIDHHTYQKYMKKFDGDVDAALEAHASLRRGPYVDHLGNEFKTLTEMAEHHHINPSTLFSRISKYPHDGFKAWLRPARQMKSHIRYNAIEVTDSQGRTFDSVKQAADFHKISKDHIFWLVKTGKCKTYSEAIDRLVEKKLSKEPIVDADGKKFDSIAQACKFRGLSDVTYHRRKRLHPDWTSEMLLGDQKQGNMKSVVDHEGREFESVKQMCAFHDLSYDTYRKRRQVHPDWTIAMLLGDQKKGHTKSVIDHKGREFESILQMCDFYGIQYATYYARKAAHPDWPMSKLLAKPRKTKN